MRACQHCQGSFEKHEIAGHVRWCSQNPKRSQYLARLGDAREARIQQGALAEQEGKASPFRNQHSNGPLPMSSETKAKLSAAHKGKPLSAETRAKMAAAQNKRLREHPELHPWKRSDKFFSVPCAHLKSKLVEAGIPFKEEFQPLQGRYYSLDIAFPEVMLALEVNGNQHYSDPRNGVLKPYYQERHDLITANGWNIVEIHFANVFKADYVAGLVETLKAVVAPSGRCNGSVS